MDTSFASASEELATLFAMFPDVDAEVVLTVCERTATKASSNVHARPGYGLIFICSEAELWASS